MRAFRAIGWTLAISLLAVGSGLVALAGVDAEMFTEVIAVLIAIF